MKIKKIINSKTTLRTLNDSEEKVLKNVLQKNLSLTSQDSVLVVADAETLSKEAALWFETCKKLTKEVQLVELEGMTRSGEEPPTELVQMGQNIQLLILQTTFSLTHTSLSKKAYQAGAKVASLPGVTYDIIIRTLDQDYQPIAELGSRIKSALESGTNLEITSTLGTKLTTKIRNSNIINDSGFIGSGELGNLPGGEVFFAPIEGSTNGTWIIDGSVADDELGNEIIRISIVDGKAVEFQGGAAAKRLEEKLKAVGPNAFIVAEIGIGTNPKANPKATLIEAEKALGTAHLALGNNAGFGGSNNVPIHLDGVTLEPSIKIDTTEIIKQGIIYV